MSVCVGCRSPRGSEAVAAQLILLRRTACSPQHTPTPPPRPAELSWYLHMLLKPVLRYGLRDGRDMLVHHCATLALIVTSYGERGGPEKGWGSSTSSWGGCGPTGVPLFDGCEVE